MSRFAARVLARRRIAPSATILRGECRIEDAAGLICDPATGKYPHRTGMRDEMERALKFACKVWGADTPWSAIDEQSYTKLLRLRLEQLLAKDCRGVRACEITVSRIITVVGWLRETRRIPRDAAPWPKQWKAQIVQHWKGIKGSVREPEPFRPRHSLEEAQAILAHSNFDPRLELLLWCGMELRLGQVCRAMRTDLDLPAVDWERVVEAEKDDSDYGTLAVFGAGKKSGTVVDLTRGQRRRIDDALAAGYLAKIEAKHQAGELTDYCLFPAGYIVGRVGFTRGQSIARTLSERADYNKHVSPSWIRKSFRTAEERAGVPHIEGRCCYGVRRQGRDVADTAELSPSAIESFGGWMPGSDIPNRIYRERANKVGGREARGARALLRGENVA